MSADAKMREALDEALREATEPLRQAVKTLSARVEALEDRNAPVAAPEPRRPSAARADKTVKAGAAQASGSSPDKAGAS